MSLAATGTMMAEGLRRQWPWLRLLLLVSLLLLPARLPANQWPGHLYEEAKYQVLGEYLANRFPGARILLITRPVGENGRDYAMPPFIKGMRGCTVTVVTFSPPPQFGIFGPEYYFTARAFDAILAANPGYDVVMCKQGLPYDFASSAFWQTPGNQRPKLAVICPYLSDPTVLPGIEDHHIAVALVDLPCGRLPSDQPIPTDIHERFRECYLLVDAGNLDRIRRAFPEIFGLKTPPDRRLRRELCPPRPFPWRLAMVSTWCGAWLIGLAGMLRRRDGRWDLRSLVSCSSPGLLFVAALVVLIVTNWQISKLCGECLLNSRLPLAGVTCERVLRLFLGRTYSYYPLPFMSAGLACVIAAAWVAWRRPRRLSTIRTACLAMTALAAGITLLLGAWEHLDEANYRVYGWPLPFFRASGNVLYLGFLALDLACFLLPMLVLGLVYAAWTERRAASAPGPAPREA